MSTKGSFANGSTVYLYVVDPNGVINTSYPITIGVADRHRRHPSLQDYPSKYCHNDTSTQMKGPRIPITSVFWYYQYYYEIDNIIMLEYAYYTSVSF